MADNSGGIGILGVVIGAVIVLGIGFFFLNGNFSGSTQEREPEHQPAGDLVAEVSTSRTSMDAQARRTMSAPSAPRRRCSTACAVAV